MVMMISTATGGECTTLPLHLRIPPGKAKQGTNLRKRAALKTAHVSEPRLKVNQNPFILAQQQSCRIL
jgi:hypothetical protein